MQDGCDPFVIMVFAKTTVIENWTHPLMTSSLTEIVLPQRPPGMPCPTVLTDGDHRSLFVALTAVHDPRDPRGRRYPLVAILTTAVCAVIAGACTFAAVSDWVRFHVGAHVIPRDLAQVIPQVVGPRV